MRRRSHVYEMVLPDVGQMPMGVRPGHPVRQQTAAAAAKLSEAPSPALDVPVNKAVSLLLLPLKWHQTARELPHKVQAWFGE